MLTHLIIDNFAIAEHLDMEFERGMTAITGETGAGKSITLDALGLALGDRADASIVRVGADKADISASFDISAVPAARRWLSERELHSDSGDNECLLRRVVSREGRSRAYINGRPAPLADLKALGNLLIDIHSQHAHQSLLKKEQQRQLLDEFAGSSKVAADVRHSALQYQQTQQRLQQLSENNGEQNARAQLLGYQVEELKQLALVEGELERLEREQKQLAGGEQMLSASQHALALCIEGELNVVNILNQALRSLAEIPDKAEPLSEAEQLLSSALIQAEEAGSEISHYIDDFELDPARLQEVERRLNSIYETARKHRIQPHQLPGLQAELQQELAAINGSDELLEQLQADSERLQQQYLLQAEKLSKKRRNAAKKLQKSVEGQLAGLSMANCRFAVDLQPRELDSVHGNGLEEVEFLVATNPGQAPQSLAKTASGGELSRISLAIQVVTVQTSATPTLVFDEVDVGIGGATAEVVGQLLRELGDRGQVLCVTHQPQVASKGHQHWFVSKQVSKKTVSTQLQALAGEQQIEEIARMLGGISITDHTLAHAEEMLASCH